MRQIRRLTIGIIATAALMTATAVVAFADPGAPGTTFPEQPGTNPTTACVNLISNPGTGLVGGASGAHISPTAQAITTGLLQDGCFGG
ncbi:MAG TPA: hypothetical protein VGR85_06135 [Candidatus Limnocylindria bacterium]|nr:hypothetical protein [Candidatus Limnocylindria bacterium]